MQIESALFFETAEQIYARVFQIFRPRTPVPQISVRYRKFAGVSSRIQQKPGFLEVDITDVLEHAPAPIQEALAFILLAKLNRKVPEAGLVARYRRYLNRADIRKSIDSVRRERGRKQMRGPQGVEYDLVVLFEELNHHYFHGLMARPELGWSLRPSRTTLGRYDEAHNTIVLSCLLDDPQVPELALRYLLYHEMLHLRYPVEQKSSRCCIHTPEFKAAEKQFENYKEAQKKLNAFVAQASREKR